MGKATNVRDLLRRQDKGGGMPWVNTTAADRNGNVLYADHSVVPHVTNGMKARCLTPVGLLLDSVAGLPGLDGTRAETDCKWGTDPDAQRPGILGPQQPARRGPHGLGDERQRLLLAAEPEVPARGLRPRSSAASGAPGRCAPGW